MNPRNTAMLLVATVLLGAFVYFYEIRGEEGRKEAETASKNVFSGITADAVTRIALAAGDGTEAVVERVDGSWRLREPVDFPGDPVTLDGLASTLANMTSEAVIDEPQAPAVYGLADDAVVIRFEADGERVLRVGSKTPVGSNSYVAAEGDDRVFMVPTFRVNSLRKEIVDLRDRSVLDFDPATIDRLQASWRGGAVTAERRDGGWWLTAPVEGRADAEAIDDLLSDLSFLRADGFEDEPRPESQSGLDAPEFQATLSGEDDAGEAVEVSFALGSLIEGGERLARGAQSSLYRVPGERLSDLPRKLVDYRFKQIARFVASEATRFELTFAPPGGESETIAGVYADAGWTTEPEPMAAGMAGGMISELSQLKGVDIVADEADDALLEELGLAPPAVRIRIWGEGDETLADVSLGEVDPDAGIAARSADLPAAMRVDAELAELVPVSLEAFRNRFISEEEPEPEVVVPDDMSLETPE